MFVATQDLVELWVVIIAATAGKTLHRHCAVAASRDANIALLPGWVAIGGPNHGGMVPRAVTQATELRHRAGKMIVAKRLGGGVLGLRAAEVN
jgi:hypothetical protein